MKLSLSWSSMCVFGLVLAGSFVTGRVHAQYKSYPQYKSYGEYTGGERYSAEVDKKWNDFRAYVVSGAPKSYKDIVNYFNNGAINGPMNDFSIAALRFHSFESCALDRKNPMPSFAEFVEFMKTKQFSTTDFENNLRGFFACPDVDPYNMPHRRRTPQTSSSTRQAPSRQAPSATPAR